MKTNTSVPIQRVLASITAAIGLTVLSTGCSINMQHGNLVPATAARSGTVNVAAAAVGTASKPKGANARVGWGRGTLFGIPIVPIYVDGDGNAALSGEIQDALKQAGYTPQVTAAGDPGKILVCQVNKFKFSNYTWLFPIVPTWGSVGLTLSVNGPDNTVLWKRDYYGSGSTLDFLDGYTLSCKTAMTEILNQMVADFDSQEFYDALNK